MKKKIFETATAKVARLKKRQTITVKFLRKLAGFTHGETLIEKFTATIITGSNDVAEAEFRSNMRNFINQGYAEHLTMNGAVVLTAKGEKFLEPYTETTCIFTGKTTKGAF